MRRSIENQAPANESHPTHQIQELPGSALSELAYHPFYGALKIGYKILDATERARADITAEGLPEVCTPSAVIR